MNVTVVCTGNVARSAALGILLAAARPDLHVTSAAVGRKAAAGRRCARPMRDLLTAAGYGPEAEAHRSRLLDLTDPPDLIVATAHVHQRRLAELGSDLPVVPVEPPLPDPAFGGAAAYAEVWPRIVAAAQWLADVLPRKDQVTCSSS